MNEYQVLFSTSRPVRTDIPQDSVVIWPVEPNWNDFGFGFQARAYISGSAQSALLECTLFVVPRPEEHFRFNTWLDGQLATAPRAVTPAPVAGRFFTILKSESEYRALIRHCGGDSDVIGRILRPMRDVVYWRWQLLEQSELEAFLGSDRVKKGIFRNEATYLAWHRGVRILAGESTNPIEDAKADFSFTATLRGFSGRHRLRLRFGAPEPLIDRCHAVIGRNGSGKSQLLRELIIELGQRLDGSAVSAFIDGGTSSASEIDFSPTDFKVNRVVAMSWDNRSQFPKNSRLNSPLQYFRFGMNEYRSEDLISDPASADASETQTAMLIQLFREGELSGRDPYDRLRIILRPVFRVDDLCVFLHAIAAEPNGRWISLDELRSSPETRQLELLGRIEMFEDPKKLDSSREPVPLSSGERTFLNFGIRGAARLTQGSLLVMDEPETHLHPNLISNFMRILAALLVETRSIALIATHSPFVVRELPGRCVHIVELDEDRVPSINTAFLKTLGASIDQLSVDIFGDAESEQLNRDLTSKIIELGLTFEGVREQYGRDISSDMLSEIHELMTTIDPAVSEDNE